VAAYRDILAVLGCADSRRNRQALHAFVHTLRGKIEADPQRPALMVNEARVGCCLAAEQTVQDVPRRASKRRKEAAAFRRDLRAPANFLVNALTR
jgi:hypothetical protein